MLKTNYLACGKTEAKRMMSAALSESYGGVSDYGHIFLKKHPPNILWYPKAPTQFGQNNLILPNQNNLILLNQNNPILPNQNNLFC